MGVPSFIIHFWDFPWKNHPALLGYPHGHGNLIYMVYIYMYIYIWEILLKIDLGLRPCWDILSILHVNSTRSFYVVYRFSLSFSNASWTQKQSSSPPPDPGQTSRFGPCHRDPVSRWAWLQVPDGPMTKVLVIYMEIYGNTWHVKKQFFWRFLMVSDGFWWFLMISESFWRFLKLPARSHCQKDHSTSDQRKKLHSPGFPWA